MALRAAPSLARRLALTLGTLTLAMSLAMSSFAAKPKKKKKPKPTPAPTTAPAQTMELDTPATGAAPSAPAAPAPAQAPTAPAPAAAEGEGESEEKAPAASPAAPPARGAAPLGRARTFVFDDLSGFRASTLGGTGYTGPIGFSAQSYSVGVPAANGAAAGSDTFHTTTFWFAPSVDYFVIDHLSIGALVQVSIVNASYDESLFGAPTKTQSLPTTTDVTFLPRGGWLFALSEHWGVWPRLGLGVAYHQAFNSAAGGAGANSNTGSFTGFIIDVDAGVLYRVVNGWFLRAGPELAFGVGSSMVSFSLAGGFGYMWSL